jgi:hypothetical protein
MTTMMRGFPRWKKNPAAPTPQAATATVTPSPDVIEPTPVVPVSQIASSRAPDETEYDEEGRRIITTPLAPPPRPVPTVLNPNPARWLAPRPAPRPTGGLLADYLAQRAADAEKSAGVRRERSAEIRDQPLPPAPRKPAPPVVMPADTPPAPVKSDAPAASKRLPAPPPRVPMSGDAGKFQLRPPATKPPQVTARTPKWPVLTADDIPF